MYCIVLRVGMCLCVCKSLEIQTYSITKPRAHSERKFLWIYNNYSMSPSWIWSDKITNERVARVGFSYPTRANGIIVLVNSQTGFCRRFLFLQFYKASGKRKLGPQFSIWRKTPTIGSWSNFLANQKARNAIVGAENLLIWHSLSEACVLIGHYARSICLWFLPVGRRPHQFVNMYFSRQFFSSMLKLFKT